MRRDSPTAFTLLELIIVIVILGILFLISTPRFRSTYEDIQLKSAAQDIINLSRLIRQQAILKQAIHRLEYKKDKSDRLRFIVSYKEGSGFIQDRDRLADIKIPRNIEIEIKKKEKAIYFYPDGTMNEVKVELSGNERRIILTDSKTKGFIFSDEEDGSDSQ